MIQEYNILVVDDNSSILTMLKIMLGRKGYTVVTKNNPDEFELTIGLLLPHLIIMDVLLSGVDGRDICTNFRKNNQFAHIPVIMISALLDAEESCLAAGAQYFLTKPFEITKFYQTVAVALERNTFKI